MRVALFVLLLGSTLWGCEADGLIWMPPTDRADPLFRIIIDGRAGFIASSGKIVIAPKLEVKSNWGQAFYDGLLMLGVSEGPFLNTSGKKVLDNGFYRLWDFSEGLAPALEKSDSKWGYVNHSGDFVISPRFPFYPESLVSGFSEGLAAVESNGKLGYIDRSGNFAIPQRFVAGTEFDGGIARVVVEGPCVFFDYENFDPCFRMSPHTAPRTGDAGRGGSSSLVACKWSYIDKTGRKLIGAEFDAALRFNEGLAAVKVGRHWGFIDKQGKFVIPVSFETAASFSNGLALVTSGKKTGFINRVGIMTIQVDPGEYAERFSEGLTTIGSWREGYLYIDTQGKQAFPGRFVVASRFFRGLAHVQLDRTNFAYIDRTGKRIFNYRRELNAGR